MKLKIKAQFPKVGPKSGAMNPEPLQIKRHNAAKCWLASDSLAEFSIVSHLPHDVSDSRITHAYVPKTAVLCRIGQKEKRWKSSDFQRFAVEVRTSLWSAWDCNFKLFLPDNLLSYMVWLNLWYHYGIKRDYFSHLVSPLGAFTEAANPAISSKVAEM